MTDNDDDDTRGGMIADMHDNIMRTIIAAEDDGDARHETLVVVLDANSIEAEIVIETTDMRDQVELLKARAEAEDGIPVLTVPMDFESHARARAAALKVADEMDRELDEDVVRVLCIAEGGASFVALPFSDAPATEA